MIDTNYRGFILIKKTDLPEYESTGLYLIHDKTGMQIFHMLNTDNENLFAFAFDTPPVDSTGVTHILEHSVLCGSKKYPLKDPFLQLSTQSVKTFLNAWTFPDKTVYPASSNVETDYFNLMSVYGDAVFFPLLDEKIFMQEGYHLEIAEDGKKSIQGVVYNEMKGAVSSPERIINKAVLQELYKNTCYAFESGGAPEEIPQLTYEQFKSYHKAHYNFSNCRVFLYGNIPTEKQLDFFLENFLTEENISFFETEKPQNLYKTPVKYSYVEPPVQITEPKTIEISVPQNTPRTFLMNWCLGEASDPFLTCEIDFLTYFLMSNDSAPLTKALLQAGIAQDISPNTDCETEMRYATFSVGLRGINPENDSKMQDIVLKVFQDLADGNINKADIESTLKKLEFTNREIRRANGPYALVLLRRALCGWIYGRSPDEMLKKRSQYDKIKQKIRETDGKWIADEIRRLFLQNNYRLYLCAVPDSEYASKTENAENQNIKMLFSKTTDEKVLETDKVLKEFQAKKENEKERSIIPHIKPKDLTYMREKETLKVKKINNTEFITTNHNVNGIIYIDYRIPVDILEPEDYIYLNFFTGFLFNLGFDNLSWEEATSLRACTFGSINVSVAGCTPSPVMLKKLNIENLKGKDLVNALYEKQSTLGRFWFTVKARFLEEDAEAAVDLFFRNIDKPDFSCVKRIEDFFNEYKNEFLESVVPSGSEYTAGRSCSVLSRFLAQDEIVHGLVQLKAIKKISKLSSNEIAAFFETYYKKLRGHGASVSVVAEEKNFPLMEKLIEKHVKDYPVIARPLEVEDDAFYRVLNLDENTSDSDNASDNKKTDNSFEGFTTETRAGYSSLSFECSPAGTQEKAQETVFCHWLSDSFLWEMIRTKGGAYGAWIQCDGIDKNCTMTSYRDPNPEKSLKVFVEALKAASKAELSDEDFERMITGTYSKQVQPHAPYDLGRIEIARYYYGITETDKENLINAILNLKKEELFEAASRLLKYAREKSHSVVIFNKIKKNIGKNINLVL